METALATAAPDMLENLRNYAKNVDSSQFPTRRPIFRKWQEMDYAAARVLVWEAYEARAEEIRAIKPGFEWRFSEAEKVLLADLVKYFVNDPTGRLNIHKGLWVYGGYGVGKTEFFQIVSEVSKLAGWSKQFEFCDLSEIHDRAEAQKDYDPVFSQKGGHRCFDEFGARPRLLSRWGNAINIPEAIVELRYRNFQRFGQITHFVSNLAPNSAGEIVGTRALDRLKDMCQSVYWPGESKRGQHVG